MSLVAGQHKSAKFSMESWAGFCTRSLIDNIVFYFTDFPFYNTHKNSSIIKVNNENLSTNGELYFLCSFKAWKSLLVCSKDCTSILQHYTHVHGTTKYNTDVDVAKEVFEQLILKSSSWPIRIQQCILQKEKVCLFLNRGDIITNSIRMAVECGMMFGSTPSTGKAFSLKYQPDIQSDLTTQRLHLMRNIAAKVLSLHGYVISNEKNCIGKYLFTSKSEGSVDEGYEKYVCGVVKNSQSKSKEICLTWDQHVKCKIDQLAELNEHKFIEDEENNAKKDLFLENLANAIVIFELMAVKPSRSVIIGNSDSKEDKSITNTKGASFVLYNVARIATIIRKYNERVLCGDYPSLPNIGNVDFSELYEEEEWELVYNFIFGYLQMINDCLKCEPNFHIYPQVLCLFLSRLCQKFSAYYRRIKILTEGSDHLISKMVARLYMLHALQVVFENALDILGIKSVSQM
ncbi:DALR anticodon-binding domain-containing protein 3 [Linepithema humile]|uniref:DALR anticodon-binding domain-containing protein 3 n=1 Tax=Linepithema humile TaxID=83485 RepID=UPI0006232833|nr:PREDICTED: DALR anticodon-binding domain-containing protein 3 [Linepithema humile]